jgi:hypothetical protein
MKYSAVMSIFLTVAGTMALAQAGERIGTQVVDDEFAEVGVRWDGGREVDILIAISESDGYFVVCAATSELRDNDDERMLRAHKIMLNGSVMLRSLAWAPDYPNPMGRDAVCRRTGSRVVADPSFDIEMTRTRF